MARSKRKATTVVTVAMYLRVMAYARLVRQRPELIIGATTDTLHRAQQELRTLDPAQLWPGQWYEVAQPEDGQVLDQKLLGWRYCTALTTAQTFIDDQLAIRQLEDVFGA